MQNTLARRISSDQTLDYLFQTPVEEQFDSFRQIEFDQKASMTWFQKIHLWLTGRN